MSLSGLEPKNLWKHFDKIRSIPHCSGHEAKLAEYLIAYAKGKGLEVEKDKTGNVVIRVPRHAGPRERADRRAPGAHGHGGGEELGRRA